jgi:hypothetical protein
MLPKLLRTAILLTFLLSARSAFAAGGTCPTGANYLDSSGSSVTLSSLGVTNCYYIAANGSDSNSGADEQHPWLNAPQMPNCSATCATVQNAKLQPGTGLIFRGGDTWHFGNSSASPYTGGPWGFNNSPAPAGTSAHPIYLGVDQTWYSGSSWSRPILTYDNPPNASQTLSSCPLPTRGNLLDLSGGAYFIVDNFEMTGVCTTSANWNVNYVSYGSLSGYANFYNLYIHGWSHVGFPNPNNCTANSTCMGAFRGGVNSGFYPPGDTLLYDVVDGSDSDPVPMEFCYCGAWHIAYSYFNNGSQFITRTQNSFHDSTILNFVDNGHANIMESAGPDAVGPSNAYAIYNNVFAHLYTHTTVNSNVGFWPFRPVGATLYWFNNLVYDAGPMEFFNGPNNANEGMLTLFNNTFQFNHRTNGGVDNISCGNVQTPPWAAPFVSANNHFISDDVASVGGMFTANCSGQGTDTTSLLMRNAAATSKGYTASQPFAYSPPASNSPTLGAGTNKQPFCTGLSVAGLSDAASACLNDTRYACTYSTSNHKMSCPSRAVVARPAGAWAVGAYQFNSAQTGAPNPPAGFTATVQ